MRKLKTERVISTGHLIRDHDGHCRRMHGHNLKVTVEILDKKSSGMIIDFGDLKDIIDEFDHKTIVDNTCEVEDGYVYIRSDGKTACLPEEWCEMIDFDLACSENLAEEIKNRISDAYPKIISANINVKIEETSGNTVETGL